MEGDKRGEIQRRARFVPVIKSARKALGAEAVNAGEEHFVQVELVEVIRRNQLEEVEGED